MAYLKIQGSGLFDGREMLGPEQVLITDEQGKVAAIIAEKDAGDDIRKVNGIVSPGFVNCHCHLELSHMKALLPESTGLVNFVTGVMQQRSFAPEQIAEAIVAGEDEMYRGGVVAVGDICNTTHTIQQKEKGRLTYHNFMEVSGFIPAGAGARMAQAVQNLEAFNSAGLNGSITAHAPYSVSPALFSLINEHSAGKITSVHNQETPEEDAFFVTGDSAFRQLYSMLGADISFYQAPGCRSLRHWLPLLDRPAQVLLVHNTCSTTEDISLALQQAQLHHQQLFWTLCVNANLYIENQVPPVGLLREMGCTITVGTDSLASNRQLSILAELKTLQTHFPDLTLAELLRWATFNGAQALQLQDRYGSFEKGRQPGVLVVDEGLNGVERVDGRW
ncbi:amidohydrolase family protein [Filimonas effusa]|uniref:Amidohydrolase n=1 Tax=Filimonas effusa TaxID=2508721 RepID=A0A4Q1CZD1_9BACT|nr:amidohydrolase family protein [Filimonas effusa]RXK80743.1 amidohydrolase [Filimonas effusa]